MRDAVNDKPHELSLTCHRSVVRNLTLRIHNGPLTSAPFDFGVAVRPRDLLIHRVLRLVGCWLTLSVVACAATSPPDRLAPGVGLDVASASDNSVKAAWIQYAMSHGWEVRALSDTGHCPSLEWDGAPLPLKVRAGPGTLPPRDGKGASDSRPAVFELTSCELPVPASATRLRVGHFDLPVPHSQLHHLVLMGDSGCRMKAAEEAFQDCLDPQAWPFARVNDTAASMHPDLVIHVGDLHYRESPCPVGRPGCAGSPWGYGDDVWMEDFFRPTASLRASAPWVVARGNHEACDRAGLGWFRFLAATDFSPALSCESAANDDEANFTHPFAVALDTQTQLIVFDSAAVSSKPYKSDSPAYRRYLALMDEVAALARDKPHSIFVNHHPALAFGGSASGKAKPGTQGLISVLAAHDPTRLYPPGIDLVVNGHVHMFQALDFSSGQPATVLTGNGGSAMEGYVNPESAFQTPVAPGAVLSHFETQPGFGFATLDLVTDSWELKEWSPTGQLLRRCTIALQSLRCGTTR